MSAIGPEDIDEFRRRWGPSLDAANEFARRKEKGIPPDRWSDGTAGAVLVANGIRAMQQIMAWQTEALEALLRPSYEATGVFDRHGNERN